MAHPQQQFVMDARTGQMVPVAAAGGAAGGVVGGGGVVAGGAAPAPAGGVVVSGGAGAGAAPGCCGAGGGAVCCGPAGAICCSTGTGGGCGAGCSGGLQTGAMMYVGSQKGDWITETTYRYVGNNKGDLMFAAPVQRNWLPCCLALLGLLLLGLLLFFFVGFTTTTTFAAGHIGTCLFWGDPHVLTFDGARPSFYGDGEYWIVKNDKIKIQGRYMGTKYTLGLASTQKVAVSGPFIGNHKIEVEPMQKEYGGAILVDGVEVLPEFGSLSVGGAIIKYDDSGELVDQATSRWAKHIVHMDLPEDVSLTVYRWGNYLDLKITMPPKDVDGSCGNFNGNVDDDTTQAIFDRIGARVPATDMLFSRGASAQFTPEEKEMLQKYCSSSTVAAAKLHCVKELPADVNEVGINACVFDQCFGMNEHALQTAKQFATQEERASLGLE